MEITKVREVGPVDMKLEVVVIGVHDIDRAKAFYEKLGWRFDGDFTGVDFRIVQMTPHNSQTSIVFGKGIKSATLRDLLRETAEHHDHYEKTHAGHNCWDWYAAYLSARQTGNSPEKAADDADRYMEGVFHVAS